jgi:hypothetical protein
LLGPRPVQATASSIPTRFHLASPCDHPCGTIDRHDLHQPNPLLQHIDGINLFGLISIVSLLYCAPAAVVAEGHVWAGAWDAAVAKLGRGALIQLLAVGGVFYHLYNMVRRPFVLY